MADGRAALGELLQSSDRNLFVLSLGFEDRCMALPRALPNVNRSRNTLLCIEHDDSNVSPLAVLQRRRLRKEIEQMVGPQFCGEHDAEAAIASALRRKTEGVVIDCSTMPRRLILHLLRAIGDVNPTFARTWLFDCGPKTYLSYVSGELEITDPVITSVYDEPDVSAHDRVSVVLFPGFNSFETSALLARLLNPTRRSQSVVIRWVFCHPGARYEFYERAIVEHGAFIRHLAARGVKAQHECLCRMDSAENIAGHLADGAREVLGGGVLIVANSGPRLLLGPAFLTVHALRTRCSANILVTQPLAYRTVRSMGEGDLRAWNLEHEYTKIANCLASAMPQ